MISATSASLYQGKNFSGSITPKVAGGAAITGTYTIGSGYSLTIPATASLVVRLGEALQFEQGLDDFDEDDFEDEDDEDDDDDDRDDDEEEEDEDEV